MRRRSIYFSGLLGVMFWCFASACASKARVAIPETLLPLGRYSWGDQGDGTYRNPVLNADFSDPDILRSGKDFYLIASDFHFVGMQILHSVDLVNWEPLAQIYPKLSMDKKYDRMNGYGQGTWAPSLRFHDGQYYIYVCTPHDGLFMWHAANPAGPWSETVTVKQVDSWEDPCPFWDEDGQAYLVHSRKGAGPLILHKMSADGTTLLDHGREIYHGPNSEGPKFYKRHGYYYISLPEKGVSTGCQTMLRAKNIYGPYERRVVLKDGAPHQGGMVELDNGQAWFMGFKSVGWLGRVCNLEPVTWGKDDWPIFGNNRLHVVQGAKPNVGLVTQPSRPSLSDDFHESTLKLLWQWNHNPVNDQWSLKETPGELHLHALPAKQIWLAKNTLTQKLWDDTGTITVELATGIAEGQRAGLAFLSGTEFGYVGVELINGERRIVSMMGPPSSLPKPRKPISKFPIFRTKPAAKTEDVLAMAAARKASPEVVGEVVGDVALLRASYDKKGEGQFSYSVDGKTFIEIPGKTTLRFLNWKGSRVGLFSYGPNSGIAAFRNFDYQYRSVDPAATAVPH